MGTVGKDNLAKQPSGTQQRLILTNLTQEAWLLLTYRPLIALATALCCLMTSKEDPSYGTLASSRQTKHILQVDAGEIPQ